MKQKHRIAFTRLDYTVRGHLDHMSRRVSRVMQSGIYLNGPENSLLVQELQTYLPGGEIILTGSGHDSLLLALRSLHLQAGEEVLFPVNAYPTAFPVQMSGAMARPVDVDACGMMDLDALSRSITHKTKAVVVVHMYGLVGPIREMKKVIGKRNIYIIEDCAQSFGSLYKDGKPTGTIGDIGCFSFYPTKNVATYGDGGAVWTKHASIARYIRQACAYGEKQRYHSEFISGHSRMPEIQAAILRENIGRLPKEFRDKQRLLELYMKRLREHSLSPYVRVLYQEAHGTPMMHLLVCEVERRDALRIYLAKHGIETLIHYPVPVHRVQAFSDIHGSKESYPMAERLSRSMLSLPFYTSLTVDDVTYIVSVMQQFYARA